MCGMRNKEVFKNSHFFNGLDPFDFYFLKVVKSNCDGDLFNDVITELCVQFHAGNGDE